jgi:hypothetical protein
MAARLLLLIMTLRMNMKPSEDNALKSVPALPTNDQDLGRSNPTTKNRISRQEKKKETINM